MPRLSPRRGKSRSGLFPCRTMEDMVPYRSHVERDELYLLDFDPDVTFIQAPARTILYWDGKKIRRYTADIHAIKRNRNLIIECKASKYKDSEAVQRQLAAGTNWCLENDWTFILRLDDEIRSGWRLQNVKFVTKFALYKVGQEFKWTVQGILERTNVITIGELASRIFPRESRSALPLIYQMIYSHELWVEIDNQKISLEIPIYLAQP
jgi:hypothetical protein